MRDNGERCTKTKFRASTIGADVNLWRVDDKIQHVGVYAPSDGGYLRDEQRWRARCSSRCDGQDLIVRGDTLKGAVLDAFRRHETIVWLSAITS
jgi:hypothetical protein